MQKTILKIAIVFLTVTFFKVPIVFAANPNVNSVSGNISDGATITISGNAFGSTGPTLNLFDNFNRGVVGNDLTLSATVGNWTAAGSYSPQVSNDGLGGSQAMATNRGAPNYGKFSKVFHGAQEVFLSYWLKIPAGTNFPGASIPQDFSTSTGGWFKQAWFMNNNGTSDPALPYGNYNSNNNIVPFSWDGHGWLVGTNNDATNFTPSAALYNPTWWNWNGWMRFTTYLKAGSIPTVDSGHAYLQVLPGNSMQAIAYDGVTKNSLGNPSPLFADMGDTPEYDQVNIPGAPYYRVDVTDPHFDDVYLATGPGAQARVEIGNASTYAASSDLYLATPTTWSDGRITATVRQGEFINGQQAYLYVIDANGNVNAVGYPVALGSTITATYSVSDFTSLLLNWLKATSSSDLNLDNITNTKDLGIMMSKWQ